MKFIVYYKTQRGNRVHRSAKIVEAETPDTAGEWALNNIPWITSVLDVGAAE